MPCAAAASDLSGLVYNVGSDNPVSINRLVGLLKAPETVYIPKRLGEPDCTFADTTRIKRDLGWKAQVPIEEGVVAMLKNIDHWRHAPPDAGQHLGGDEGLVQGLGCAPADARD